MKFDESPNPLSFVVFVAMLALYGCGGGSGNGGTVPAVPDSQPVEPTSHLCQLPDPPDYCGSVDTPPPNEDQRAALALDRAVVAASAAAAAFDEALDACTVAEAACDAALDTAIAAITADIARQTAEAATTVAEVEQAADAAEAAARDAEDAAAEAKRLAGSEPPGDGGQPPGDNDQPPGDDGQPPDNGDQPPDGGSDNVNWPEWPIDPVAARPMVGGLEIEDTSSDTILAHLEAVANLKTPYPYADVFHTGNVSWWHLPNVEFSPVMRSAGNIPLFQARTSDQRFPDSSEAPEGFIGYGGWMDYSYFIMGLSTSESRRFFYDPDDPKPYESTSSGYRYGVYDYFPPGSGKFYEVDMHWLGAVIGTDKTLATSNFVQGTVHMTIREDARYDTRMEVDFKNLVNLTTGSIYHSMGWDRVSVYGRSFDSTQGSPEGNLRFTIDGAFTGPNAEEAVGKFDRDSLTGVFGAKRHTCIPAPCRH